MLPRLRQRLVNRGLAGLQPCKVTRLPFRVPHLHVHEVLRSPHVRHSGQFPNRLEPLPGDMCAWIGQHRRQSLRATGPIPVGDRPQLCALNRSRSPIPCAIPPTKGRSRLHLHAEAGSDRARRKRPGAPQYMRFPRTTPHWHRVRSHRSQAAARLPTKAPVRPVADPDHMPNRRTDCRARPRNHSCSHSAPYTIVSQTILPATNKSSPTNSTHSQIEFAQLSTIAHYFFPTEPLPPRGLWSRTGQFCIRKSTADRVGGAAGIEGLSGGFPKVRPTVWRAPSRGWRAPSEGTKGSCATESWREQSRTPCSAASRNAVFDRYGMRTSISASSGYVARRDCSSSASRGLACRSTACSSSVRSVLICSSRGLMWLWGCGRECISTSV